MAAAILPALISSAGGIISSLMAPKPPSMMAAPKAPDLAAQREAEAKQAALDQANALDMRRKTSGGSGFTNVSGLLSQQSLTEQKNTVGIKKLLGA